jgi:hypothetical protein
MRSMRSMRGGLFSVVTSLADLTKLSNGWRALTKLRALSLKTLLK